MGKIVGIIVAVAIVLALVIVILVLVITELMGYTDIIPNWPASE